MPTARRCARVDRVHRPAQHRSNSSLFVRSDGNERCQNVLVAVARFGIHFGRDRRDHLLQAGGPQAPPHDRERVGTCHEKHLPPSRHHTPSPSARAAAAVEPPECSRDQSDHEPRD